MGMGGAEVGLCVGHRGQWGVSIRIEGQHLLMSPGVHPTCSCAVAFYHLTSSKQMWNEPLESLAYDQHVTLKC